MKPISFDRQRRRRHVARWGETCAAYFLRLHGYRIIDRNLRTPVAEVDLLAQRDDTLVVCEVKSRRGAWEGTISEAQQRRLARAALWLLPRYGSADHSVRVDLLAVNLRGRWALWPRVVHYPGVIEAAAE